MTSAKRLGFVLVCLAVAVVLAGTTACKKEAVEADVAAQMTYTEYEGTVKTALGRYLYLPTAQGFDIVLQGFDAATLVGKDIKIKGELLDQHPSIFQADSVDVKGEAGTYSNVFTRTVEFQMEDFVEVKDREGFQPLIITGVNKPDEWQNKGRGKVFGVLKESTVKEAGQEKTVTHIVLSDDRGRESGKIVVDGVTTYAQYYMRKLRLFDSFWLYLDIKDTVDAKVRTRSKELFRADVIYAGLY
ncbi:MAG: hypothetical protein FJY79_08085 [Candidatus Aminicenantes bacterium]|nr:hypothetical protein [Candidatus Aminicenantes bacterium]